MSKLNYDDMLALKIGTKLYEYAYGVEIISTVVGKPYVDYTGDNEFVHVPVVTEDGEEFEYGVNKKYQHYGPNVYNYEAYITL